MKTMQHTFRTHVQRVVLTCLLVSFLLTFVCAYVLTKGNVLAETANNQRAAALYLLALEQKTDLTVEEMTALASSGTTKAERLDTAKTTLTAEESVELASKLILFEERGPLDFPVTYVLLNSDIVRITSHTTGNLFLMTSLRFFSSLLLFFLFLIIPGIFFSRRLSNPVAALNNATAQVAKGNFTVRLPVHGDDEIAGIMRNFNDMTEALARMDRLQNDFISNVSHEFKTPIASIQGYARMLQMPNLSEAERQEYIAIIAEESRRLSHLSQNLLHLSRLEGSVLGENKSYPLDEQLRRIVVQLEPQWSPKALEWDLCLSPTLLCANEDVIAQIWINLLENAIKFSSGGGRITLRCLPMEGMARVDVIDEGLGMDSETQKHIFDRFYQGDTSHSAEGSGLGLCIVKRIAERCHGTVQVTSALGKGSTFAVTLPLDPDSAQKGG